MLDEKCEIEKLLEKGKYKDASQAMRQLYKESQNPYYELEARIFDLMDNPPKNMNDAESYIDSFIYNNPSLKNKANYMLGEYFLKYRQSYYLGYKRFKLVPININTLESVSVLKRKIEILQDVDKASKALRKLKPYSKIADANILGQERMAVLIEAISTFALLDKGYLYWEDFIENIPDNSWKPFLSDYLIYQIDKLKDLPIDNLIEKSYITKINLQISEDFILKTDSDAIFALRGIKGGLSDVNNIEKVESCINGALAFVENNGNKINILWTRYYASIIFSTMGLNQKANDIAITQLYLAGKYSDKNKKLALALGLIAFGYSQYRIGNQVEGLACVITAIDFCIELEEILPLIEDCLNIIFRFIIDNNALFNDKKIKIELLFDKWAPYIKSGEINQCLIKGDNQTLYKYLHQKVAEFKIKNSDWASMLTNLIGTCYKLNNLEEAVKLILLNYKEAIPLLTTRRDLRAQILLIWSELLYQNLTENNFIDIYNIILELLNIAADDVEYQRNVFHKKERAYVGDKNRNVYLFYLEVLSALTKFKNIPIHESKYREEVKKIIPKLLPRSIIEQKKYNCSKNIVSTEFIELEQEYYNLFSEIQFKLNQNNVTEKDKKKINRFQELDEYLKMYHPYYKSLNNIEDYNLEQVKENLKPNDVLYQFIKTQHGIFTLILTNKKEFINFDFIESTEYQNINKNLELLSYNLINGIDNNFRECCQFLSSIFYKDLLNYTKEHKIDKLYILSDSTIGFFSPNLVYYNDFWLIKNVKSINNIIDYNAITKEANNRVYNDVIIGKSFGKNSDSAILLTCEWLNKKNKTDIIGITNLSDDIKDLTSICEKKNPKILILFAHGIMDANSNFQDGSIAIQGNNKSIKIETILNKCNSFQNLILISCRGGKSFINQIESSSGIWNNILEQPIHNIILCRWDVPVKSTLEILDIIIKYITEENCNLSEALIKAQVEVFGKYDFQEWAGLEFWNN